MDMEGALRARLLAAAPVTALVGQKIYWEERPQAAALPAITLNLVVDRRPQHMGGFQSVRDGDLQVDVWATKFSDKKAIKEAVIAALAPAYPGNGIRFQAATSVDAFAQNERTETQYIYHEIVRMTLHYSPV